jgi:hypothetical protein
MILISSWHTSIPKIEQSKCFSADTQINVCEMKKFVEHKINVPMLKMLLRGAQNLFCILKMFLEALK